VVVIALLCGGVISAQQPVAKATAEPAYVPSLTFDVASIRESKPEGTYMVGGLNPAHSSMVRFSNMDVSNLLAVAYGVQRAQILKLPDWASGYRGPFFNLEAKSDHSVDEQLAKLSDEQAKLEKQHMLQMLLADRFQLRVHWGAKEGSIYELIVAKSGPKLHPGGSRPPTPEELRTFDDKKIPPMHLRDSSMTGLDYVGHSCSMDSLAQWLSGSIDGSPVINKTGLTGTYDFDLKYRGYSFDDASDDPSVSRPLMEALPEQLGLKLQPAKGEKQFLVIDHIERPSAN
jgi:uncharacterized protein (TIGR03435 family)